jgi:hypothetical protein
MHVGIGVLLALPFFSLIMIVTDMLFIRDATYHRATFIVAALRERRNHGSSSGALAPVAGTTEPARPAQVA